jgi:predicted nucleic acid-binding protein
MAMTLPSNQQTGAVVVDANVVISISARETATEATSSAALVHYSSVGYNFFAPGVIVSETLYVLCGKIKDGSLSVADHANAVLSFNKLMATILPPPAGDFSLILARKPSGVPTPAAAPQTASTSRLPSN